jgi:hypothetical protein
MFHIEKLNQEKVLNFKRQVGMGLEKFCDHELSAMAGVFVLDLFRFEDHCKMMWGYKDEDSSFAKFCSNHFGKDFLDFISYLINITSRRNEEK